MGVEIRGYVDSRLQEAVAAFQLLVLVPDYLDAIDYLHEACLKCFGLSDGLLAIV